MPAFINNYLPPEPELWQGRKDSLPFERYYQRTQFLNLQESSFSDPKGYALIGFACDEGIRRNLGRQGASLGPNSLKRHLAKLACHNAPILTDLGNIHCYDDNLEIAQQALAEIVRLAQKNHYKTLAIGGGHEIAWGHFSGLTQQYTKLGIINFDAHFDLRPCQDNVATSGTPFWQIAQYCSKENRHFDYCCIGIQNFSNTQSLFEIANEYKVSYLTAEQIHQTSLAWQTAFLDEFLLNHDVVYLTLCLDVLAECYAPGVSAPQALGLSPWQILPLLKYILQTGKVVALDIAELSPPLDYNEKTSRLAAMILAEILEF